MISRWAYEALAVYQFKNNLYQKKFYLYDREKSIAEYKKDYWLKTLENKINFYQINQTDTIKQGKLRDNFHLLKNEISKELLKNSEVKLNLDLNRLSLGVFDSTDFTKLIKYFQELRDFYNNRYNVAIKLKDKKILEMQKDEIGKESFKKLKRDYSNERLSEFVRNADGIDVVKEYDGQLFQKIDPIFFESESGFIKAHFYAPTKAIFGKQFNTIWVNIAVIGFITIALFVCLYFRILVKGLDLINYMQQIKKNKNRKNLRD
jgi:hypothetical protein